MSTMIVTEPKERNAEPALLACAEWVDETGSRCGLPAQALGSDMLRSTHGQVEHIRTRCLAGHRLNCPAESFA